MMNDVQMETDRLLFSAEREIVMMELRETLEKVIKLENELRDGVKNLGNTNDFYRPDPGTVLPPKKKMRME